MIAQLSTGNSLLDTISVLILDVAMVCIIVAVIRRRL